MKISNSDLYNYEILLVNGKIRSGLFLKVLDDLGRSGFGEAAPLTNWSLETMEEVKEQWILKKAEIQKGIWTITNCFERIAALNLLPSLAFALESALLSLLNPLPKAKVKTSALFMGSYAEILQQASFIQTEEYLSAKLKVSQLDFDEASKIIHLLKDKFYLRIDVNRAWETSDSLQFFAQFPLDTFDYVEEPFKNPHDLEKFLHPVAVDESFPTELSLKDLENLPTLKALIYKPTIQGGITYCLSLKEWASKREIELVLSSCFESDLGLAHVASMAHRLSLKVPVGLGTYDFLQKKILPEFQIINNRAHIPSEIIPQIDV